MTDNLLIQLAGASLTLEARIVSGIEISPAIAHLHDITSGLRNSNCLHR